MNRIALPLALAALAVGAQAQLVVATNLAQTSGYLSGAFYVDVQTETARQLWTGAQTQARATGIVSIGNTLYGASGLRGFSWNYGDIGTAPAQIDQFYRLGANGTIYGTAFENMTFAGGGLYSYTNFNTVGGTQVEDGIYRIDPNNRVQNSVDTTLIWRHDDLKYNFKGFAYNEANGLFYATNNPGSGTTTREPGIYTIDAFGSGAVTKIADFDSAVPETTGLTFGGGKLWMSGKADASTELRVVSFDLATGTYGSVFAIGGFAAGTGTAIRSTALVWAPGAAVPEPATIAALGLGAVVILRRKRRA